MLKNLLIKLTTKPTSVLIYVRGSDSISAQKNTSGIDWAGIRAAAVTLGIRNAARNAAKTLPAAHAKRFVDRIRKRAQREHWSQDKVKALATAQTAIRVAPDASPIPLSPTVATGAEAVANALAEDNQVTRFGLSMATRKAAQALCGWNGEEVIDRSEDLRRIVSSAAELHSWGENGQRPGPIQVNVLADRSLVQVTQEAGR